MHRTSFAGRRSERRDAAPAPPTRVLGYVLTPIGASPATQTEAIAAWCGRSRWELWRVVHDVKDAGQRADRRLGLSYALREIDQGRVAGLVCERLSDVADSIPELVSLLQWFADRDAFLLALDEDMERA